MVAYHYEQETFVIKNYDQAKTFSSFLPGIAGLHGVPLWAFYVNRGQGLCSFGVQDKNSPILEFFPANTSYQYVHNYGFRTFIKIDQEVYEPFAPTNVKDETERYMYTEKTEFKVREINKTRGIDITVTYFGLPSESFGALVRKVEIKNISNVDKDIEVIDGLANLLPYGSENHNYKAMSNLLRSWMDVFNLEAKIPFFKLRASTGDEAEVSTIERGHFAYAFSNDQELLDVIVDADLVFGYDTTLSVAANFMNKTLSDITKEKQVTANKVPCQFATLSTIVCAGQAVNVNTLIGHVEAIEVINDRIADISTQAYIEAKQQEAKEIIDELVGTVKTKTANSVFDAYAKQNYLDNLLRGGYPLTFGDTDAPKVYHVYSRRHGDLERDYNFFSIAPEYYSQGNGNFRDVNQNRRNDVFFNPKVGLYNVKTFMNLIQLDGYNPLGVLGSTFTIENAENATQLVKKHFKTGQDVVLAILNKNFTPGQLVNTIAREGIELVSSEETMLNDVLCVAVQNIEADFGEGFWVDHWTYNFDLIENYLLVHPEKYNEFMFNDKTYRFFESPVYVLPRKDKHVLTKNNTVRQYGSIIEDEEKVEKLNLNPHGANWTKTNFGKGEIYEASLFEKMMTMALHKFTSLDSHGMGIEMEANKPGWNDAMNGLPGVFGSGMSESIELVRVLKFIKTALENTSEETFTFLSPVTKLLKYVSNVLEAHVLNSSDDFAYWNEVCELKESYRLETRFGIAGDLGDISLADLKQLVENMLTKLERGFEKALTFGEGVMPTYFYYEALDYEVNKDAQGEVVITHYGLPSVTVKSFKAHLVPYFLEGPARYLKINKDVETTKIMHERLKETDVFDKKLQMYKTSGSLDEMSMELGRIRAFTPGWLERESIFLHMTYKYVYGLLKAGLYTEFFEALKTNFVCFLDPEMYGRPTLENSSFIASSANPNESLHGQGFVARLSGSTAEYLSIWNMMMVGKKWFTVENEQLTLNFNPILPEWLFDENNQVSFKFLSGVTVTYTNPSRVNTFDESAKISHIIVDGQKYEGASLVGEVANNIRNQVAKVVEVVFE